VKIHTIAFNCESPAAVKFLRDVAKAFGGNFHQFSRLPRDDDDAPCETQVDATPEAAARAEADAGGSEVSGDDVDALQVELARIDECSTLAIRCREALEKHLVETAKPPSAPETKLRWGESASSARRQRAHEQQQQQQQQSATVKMPHPRPTRSSALKADVAQRRRPMRGTNSLSDSSELSSDEEGESADAGRSSDSGSDAGHGSEKKGAAFVSNLAPGTTESVLAAFFAAHRIPVDAVSIPWDYATNRLRRHAYVTLPSRRALEKATRLSGAVLAGVNIVVREAATPL
jgi:hypothetical protein